MTKVFGTDLNDCISLESTFSHIGVNFLSDEFVGFVADEEMMKGFSLPKDCEEVTFTKWKELFKKSDVE